MLQLRCQRRSRKGDVTLQMDIIETPSCRLTPELPTVSPSSAIFSHSVEQQKLNQKKRETTLVRIDHTLPSILVASVIDINHPAHGPPILHEALQSEWIRTKKTNLYLRDHFPEQPPVDRRRLRFRPEKDQRYEISKYGERVRFSWDLPFVFFILRLLLPNSANETITCGPFRMIATLFQKIM